MNTNEDNTSGPGSNPWVNISVASSYLGISKGTLRRWVKAGRVKPKRTPGGEYRFRVSELDALLD